MCAGDSRRQARRQILPRDEENETADDIVDALELKEPKENEGASSSTSTLRQVFKIVAFSGWIVHENRRFFFENFHSGISTPTIHKRTLSHNRMRYDSTSQKELLVSWIREESKNLLDLYFAENETESETGLESRMNVAKEGLTSDDKNARIEALKTLTDVVMVSFVGFGHFRYFKRERKHRIFVLFSFYLAL